MIWAFTLWTVLLPWPSLSSLRYTRIMPRRSKPQPTSSMYPSRHDDVSQLLDESNIEAVFYNVDDQRCENSHDTNIMGKFTCHNPKCATKGWSSKRIAMTIRLYSGGRYNARVYHQRCKACNQLSRPKLDHSYADRVAYRLKKWSGVSVEPPPFGRTNDDLPHESSLCEGCKAGHCLLG
jgi:hypothetical protein